MTALAGLPVYMDLAKVIGLSKSIEKHLKVRKGGQGWTDSQIVLSLVLLNLAGDDCVDDVKILEADDGFCEVLKKAEMHDLRRKVRRALLRRWRKEKTRAVPSPSAIFRYLEEFHDIEQEKLQLELPFPTMDIEDCRYKVFGMVTNMDWEGEELIHWLHERCGKSEEVHAVMKDDLAGGKLPSDDFGENAAWWWIMVLSHNLNAMMKKLAMKGSWLPKRMKAIRYSFINLPGRVVKGSRSLIIRLTKNNPAMELLINARKKIAMLQPLPSG